MTKTHSPIFSGLNEGIQNFKNKFISRGDLTHITVREQALILDELSSFDLGKHILLSGGANGFWTDYMISPQEYLNLEDSLQNNLSLIEMFFLYHSPVILAQRELFGLSQKAAQNLLGNDKTFASVPCGVMRDLLTLDFSLNNEISLVGIDIDPLSLKHAEKLAKSLGIKNAIFVEGDAWNLEYKEEFDFISSIGLNVYEEDHGKVINLYSQLYKALKSGGVLFTGVLTWPPYIDLNKSEWRVEKILKFDLHMEEVIHKNILDIKWLNFRVLSEIENEFKEAGFSEVEILKDSRCIFPAVVARK